MEELIKAPNTEGETMSQELEVANEIVDAEVVEDDSTETPSETPTYITTWEAHRLTNKMLEEMGVEKVLPPQMFYNYTTARLNKGVKPLIACTKNEAGKTQILVTDFLVWVEKYTKRAQALQGL